MAVCKICGAAVSASDTHCSACGNPVGQAPTLLRKGELFDGKYEVLDFLGAGGMGELYTVKHIHLLDTRCIKIMRPTIAQSDADNKRFIAEARIATRIQHPNVAVLYDFCQLSTGNFYMVWEYIPGKDVSRVLQACGRMPLALAVRVMAEALEGLDNIHKNGVVHRDISPENLMMFVNQFGELKIKIIDLGIAKSFSTGENLTQTGMFMGKLKYCSPEQVGFLEEGEQIDARTDIYSIGLVLYEMVEGKAPFQSTTPYGYIHKHITVAPAPVQVADLPGEVGQRFNAALMVALEKDRNRRYASARDFREALLALALPVPAEEAVEAYLAPSGLHPAHGSPPAHTAPAPARTATPPPVPVPTRTKPPTKPSERPTDSTVRMPTPAAGTPAVPQDLLESGATLLTPSRGTSDRVPGPALEEAMETGRTLLSGPKLKPAEEDPDRTTPRIPTTPPTPFPPPPPAAVVPPPQAASPAVPTREATPPPVPAPAGPPARSTTPARPEVPPPPAPVPASPKPEPAPAPGPRKPAPAPAPPKARPAKPKPAAEPARPRPVPRPEAPPPELEASPTRKPFPKVMVIAPLVLLVLAGLAVIGVKVQRSRTSSPARGEGYLSLQVSPWGTVRSLVDSEGASIQLPDPVTPLYAPLPEGRYTAVVAVAETGATLDLEITIRSGEVTALSRSGPEPDDAPFLDRIR